MSTELGISRLIDSEAPSTAYDNQVIAACEALDRQFQEIYHATLECIILPAIQSITNEDLIDHLAYQLHVDAYDATRPIEFKKELVMQSLPWHMTKGTVQCVQDVIDAYYSGGAAIHEWYQYRSPLPPNYPTDDPGGAGTWHDRYRFRIMVDQAVIPPSEEAAMLALVDKYKPVSRWIEALIYSKLSTCLIYWAGASHTWHRVDSDAPSYP
jgi:phage tail P2-like protein